MNHANNMETNHSAGVVRQQLALRSLTVPAGKNTKWRWKRYQLKSVALFPSPLLVEPHMGKTSVPEDRQRAVHTTRNACPHASIKPRAEFLFWSEWRLASVIDASITCMCVRVCMLG